MVNQNEEGWEYADANTQYHIHGIHPYPARMIPQIANRLIRTKSSPGDTVLDPFCGSGSVLAEALLLGRNAIGGDINPLAHLISKTKTTPLNLKKLDSITSTVLDKVEKRILDRRNKNSEVVIPIFFPDMPHWFKKEVVWELAIIRNCIEELIDKEKEENIYNFFLVCFSMTVRETSNIRMDDNPYFIRAMVDEELEKHQPDVLHAFKNRVIKNVDRMREFVDVCPKNVSAKVILSDARDLPLDDNSVNLIVTSPPYGEESHTMSYSRFAKLSLFWMGYTPERVNSFTKKSLGGGGASTVLGPLNSSLLNKIYNNIALKDKKRAREVFSFFWDYSKCLFHMFRVLKKGGYCCIVIGDRTAAGISVSNSEITKELGESVGFKYETTFYREIPKKVLPRRDYKVDLINRESIVILKKDES
jgi:tRNA G10  N-methylase Trm11